MKNEIISIGMIALLIALVLAILVLGSMSRQEACKTPEDCESLPHIECVGEWECIENTCAWRCEGVGSCELMDSSYCEIDLDCICGGIDTVSGECFLGNRDYYESCVNKTGQCPDYCGGIAGNLEVRCKNNNCVQVVKGRCADDSDCAKAGCSSQLCMLKSEVEKGGITTCEWREEYGCLRFTSCDCVDGQCQWIENQAYLDCMANISSNGIRLLQNG
jgi:eight-cysteine-cluster-containing protein